MSNNGGGGDMDKEDDLPQPRQPRNLQDLVRYSIEAGSSQGRQQQRTSDEISEQLILERRRFLQEALKSLTEDVTKELAEAINTLKGYRDTYVDDDNISTYECALDIVAEHVDNIDCANDFCKLGGYEVVPICLNSQFSSIRWRMCDILAQCTQNNPFCQQHAINENFLKPLLLMVDKDGDDTCRIKAFFAVSNIVRDHSKALEEFMKLDGLSVVLRAMQSNIEKLRNKSIFFLSSLLIQRPDIISEVFNMGFVEQLVSLIQREHSNIHEHIVSTLLTIVKNYEPAQKECRRPELALRSSINYLLQHYQNDDAFCEEMGFARELMSLLFSDDSEEER